MDSNIYSVYINHHNMQDNDDFDSDNYNDRGRTTTVSYQTHDQNQIESIIREVTLHHNLTLPNLVATCEHYPNIKQQSKLINELFMKPELVKDIIYFLMSPIKMLSKYGLSYDDGCRYVRVLAFFLKQNPQFYQFYFIGVEKEILKIDVWFQFLDDLKMQNLCTSLGYLASILIPFIKYQYSTSSRICDYYQKINLVQIPILVVNLFPQPVIDRLLKFTNFQAVFKVLFNLVLFSLQGMEWKRSLSILKDLCLSGIKDSMTLDTHIENIYWMIKQISNNITNDKNRTIFAFSDAFCQTSLVSACLSRVTYIFKNNDEPRKNGTFKFQEQVSIEYNMKILGEIVYIYYLLRKSGINCEAQQMKSLKKQIIKIFKQIPSLIAIIKNLQFKVLPFSTGQNIRSIGLYVYEFFNVLRISLLLVKDYGQLTEQKPAQKNINLVPVSLPRSQILQILQKYLSQNRWNNIMHCLIQKLVCLLINTQFFKLKSASIHNFLEFLIEAFSNRKFVFLNSTKMTSQGDIHSLYIISRKISNQLEKASVLFNISNEYDTWKNFIINSLQSYENKSERISCKLPQQEQDQFQRHEKDEDFKIEIDELVTIKQMVKRIQINKKWNIKKDHELMCMMKRSGSTSNLQKKISHKIEKNQYLGNSGVKKVTRLVMNDEKEGGEVTITTYLVDEKGETECPADKEEKMKKIVSHESKPNILINSHSDTELPDETVKQKVFKKDKE